MKRRILSFILAMLMVFTTLPLMMLTTSAEEAQATNYNALYVTDGLIGHFDAASYNNDGKDLLGNNVTVIGTVEGNALSGAVYYPMILDKNGDGKFSDGEAATVEAVMQYTSNTPSTYGQRNNLTGVYFMSGFMSYIPSTSGALGSVTHVNSTWNTQTGQKYNELGYDTWDNTVMSSIFASDALSHIFTITNIQEITEKEYKFDTESKQFKATDGSVMPENQTVPAAVKETYGNALKTEFRLYGPKGWVFHPDGDRYYVQESGGVGITVTDQPVYPSWADNDDDMFAALLNPDSYTAEHYDAYGNYTIKYSRHTNLSTFKSMNNSDPTYVMLGKNYEYADMYKISPAIVDNLIFNGIAKTKEYLNGVQFLFGGTGDNERFPFAYRNTDTTNPESSNYKNINKLGGNVRFANLGSDVVVGGYLASGTTLTNGVNMKVYGVRVYDRALSEAEMAQNHFADLAKYYQLDLAEYNELLDAGKAYIHSALKSFNIKENDDTNKANIEAAYEAAFEGARIEDALAAYEALYVQDGLIARFKAEEYSYDGKDLLGNSVTVAGSITDGVLSGAVSYAGILDKNGDGKFSDKEAATVEAIMAIASNPGNAFFTSGFTSYNYWSYNSRLGDISHTNSTWWVDKSGSNGAYNAIGFNYWAYTRMSEGIVADKVFTLTNIQTVTEKEYTYAPSSRTHGVGGSFQAADGTTMPELAIHSTLKLAYGHILNEDRTLVDKWGNTVFTNGKNLSPNYYVTAPDYSAAEGPETSATNSGYRVYPYWVEGEDNQEAAMNAELTKVENYTEFQNKYFDEVSGEYKFHFIRQNGVQNLFDKATAAGYASRVHHGNWNQTGYDYYAVAPAAEDGLNFDGTFEMLQYVDGEPFYFLNEESNGTSYPFVYGEVQADNKNGLKYATAAEQKFNNYGTGVSVGRGNTAATKIYEVRIYDRALTEDEMAQNHFADLANKFELDITKYSELTSVGKNVVNEALKNYNIGDNEAEIKDVYETAIEEAIEVENSLIDAAGELLEFLGYQTRTVSYPGLRSLYRIDVATLEELEAAGYEVIVGAIMANAANRTIEDVVVPTVDGKYNSAAFEDHSCKTNGMSIIEVYDGTQAEEKKVGKFLTDDGSVLDFAYTTTFKSDVYQTAQYYQADLLYRGYAVIKDAKGLEFIIYADMTSEAVGGGENGEAVSLEELSRYMYNVGYTYDMIYKVLNEIDGTNYKGAAVAGHNIGEFDVVYESSFPGSGKEFSRQINEILYSVLGTNLAVRSDAEPSPAGKPYKIYLKNDDSKYGVAVEGNNLVVYYNETTGALAIEKFEKIFANWETEKVMVPRIYSDIVTVDTYNLVFLGDSNTASALIMTVYDAYLQSQYGNAFINVNNAGVSGQRAQTTNYTTFGSYTYPSRLEREVLNTNADGVIVGFGINDLGSAGLYSYPSSLKIGTTIYQDKAAFDAVTDDEIETMIQARLLEGSSIAERNTYLYHMKSVYTQAHAKGIDVIFTSPVMYDEDRALHSTKNCSYGMYKVFPEMAAELETYAGQNEGIRFADYYKTEIKLNAALKATANEGEYVSIMLEDRTHFDGYMGPLACVYGAIGSLVGTPVANGVNYRDHMARVEINATTSAQNASGAAVENLVATEDGVTFTYKPQGVSLYETEEFKTALELIGEGKEYFSETIKVEGLSEGTYTLKLDEYTVGSYTAAELAAGVDIANLATNPQTAIAKQIWDLEVLKRDLIIEIRDMQYVFENGLIKRGITDKSTRDEVNAAIQDIINTESAGSYLRVLAEKYMVTYDNLDEMNGEIALYKSQIKELVSGLSYEVQITK